MRRAYYSATLEKFQSDQDDLILGELTRNHQFALEDLQRNAWISQILILKKSLTELPGCYVAFEYAIPRMGKRIDIVLLYQGIVFALEFKVGEKNYTNPALEQSLDYAVDLKISMSRATAGLLCPLSLQLKQLTMTLRSIIP